MSCFEVSVTRKTPGVAVTRNAVTRNAVIVRDALQSAVIEPIRIAADVARHRHEAFAARVCRTSVGASINVYPDVVWLTEDNDFSAYFEVRSNTEWIVSY